MRLSREERRTPLRPLRWDGKGIMQDGKGRREENNRPTSWKPFRSTLTLPWLIIRLIAACARFHFPAALAAASPAAVDPTSDMAQPCTGKPTLLCTTEQVQRVDSASNEGHGTAQYSSGTAHNYNHAPECLDSPSMHSLMATERGPHRGESNENGVGGDDLHGRPGGGVEARGLENHPSGSHRTTEEDDGVSSVVAGALGQGVDGRVEEGLLEPNGVVLGEGGGALPRSDAVRQELVRCDPDLRHGCHEVQEFLGCGGRVDGCQLPVAVRLAEHAARKARTQGKASRTLPRGACGRLSLVSCMRASCEGGLTATWQTSGGCRAARGSGRGGR